MQCGDVSFLTCHKKSKHIKKNMKTLSFQTQGTCAKFINVTLTDDGVVEDVEFAGGCNGNTKGIASLVRGMKAEDVIKRLEGITCGMKTTSCPNQFAQALKQML